MSLVLADYLNKGMPIFQPRLPCSEWGRMSIAKKWQLYREDVKKIVKCARDGRVPITEEQIISKQKINGYNILSFGNGKDIYLMKWQELLGKAEFEKTFKEKRALDIGAGWGELVRSLRCWEGHDKPNDPYCLAEGIDPNYELVQKLNVPFIKIGDALNLPYPDNTFEAVICTEVFGRELPYYPLYSPEQILTALCEMHRVLKPGGLAFFTINNSRYRGSNYDYDQSLQIWLKEVGFETVIPLDKNDHIISRKQRA